MSTIDNLFSLDYEQMVLSLMMVDLKNEAFDVIIKNKITEETFYFPSNKDIFKACFELYKKNQPINETSVRQKLIDLKLFEKIGGEGYFLTICNKAETFLNFEHYVRKIKKLEVARDASLFSRKLLEDINKNTDEVFSVLDQANANVVNLLSNMSSDCIILPKDALNSLAMELANKSEGKEDGVKTGFEDVDKIVSCLPKKNMIVLAARPSVGKTALALNIAKNVITSKDNKPVLFFSLEMSCKDIWKRLLSDLTGISSKKFGTNFCDIDALVKKIGEIKNLPLFMDETPVTTIFEIKAKAKYFNKKHPLGLIIIDYLQLINGSDKRIPREQQIAEISKGVKSMAKELDVPVLVLSQLNRAAEKENREPRLSDLRESGSIEQDADIVLLLSKKINEEEENPYSDNDLRTLIVAKNRNGEVGVTTLLFEKQFTRFRNLER
jgi:replicative DNA helicase